MNDEGLTAVLGLVLVQVGGEVRVPMDNVENGLPDNSAVRVFHDEDTDELVIRIAERLPESEQEVVKEEGQE